MVPRNPRNDCVTMAVYSLSASTLPLLRKSLFRLVIRSLLLNFRAPALRQFCSKGFLMTPAWKHSFLALAIVFVILASGSLIPPAMAQANVEGQWQTLPTLAPINPIHLAMLHNGQVLIVSGSGNDSLVTYYQAGVWNPATGTITTQPVTWDMFCNGMIILPDGRPFIMGGTLQYNPSFLGVALTSAYDPVTGNFYNLQSMAHGRWYPTATVLGNGQVMTFSGLTETGETNTAVEIYTVGSGWSTQYTASWTPPLYPRMTLLSNGNVFFSGSTPEAWTFDPATQVWTTGPYTNYGGTRTYGTTVLLPLSPSNSYAPKIMIMGGGSPATATTELISPLASSPSWAYGPSMSQPRIEMNATILPSGNILALGGSQIDEDGTTASLNADLYDPSTNTFSSAGANVYPRLYHSSSILLPDATVLLVGSNPTRGVYEEHMEIYSPAYLFTSSGSLATRPTITSVTPGVIGYGATFQVQTPQASTISSAVLMRPGAVTHAFDMDQRLINLSYTVGSGVLTVTAPPNGNVAPPGYYMLFILNSSGVPSLATFVQLSAKPTDTPPTGSITSPSSNPTIGPGQTIDFAGSGTAPDGSIAAYSWVFPGGSPASSTLANPGAVTYSTPGTYVASLTVTDNDGLTDPSPETRTVTVVPDFSLSVAPSSQSVAPKNNTTYTLNITPNTGFSGTVSFSVGGLPSGATAVLNPSTVVGSGSTILTVSTTSSTLAGTYPLSIAGTSGILNHTVSTTLDVITSSDTTAPSAPTNLTATAASSTQINLTWTASTDNVGVTGYRIDRCEGASCSSFTQVGNSTATSFSDTGVLPSTSYSYEVQASDAAGNLSTFSKTASATTPATPPAAVTLVQQAATTAGTGVNSVVQDFPGPSVSGNLIVVTVKWGDQTISVSSVTDNKDNAYTSAVGPTNWSGTAKRAQSFYAKNIIGGGAPIGITVNLTGDATSSLQLFQAEYTNADINSPVDVTSAAVGTGTAMSSGTATTTSPYELIYGIAFEDSGAPTAGAGFATVTSFNGNLSEDKNVATTGANSATATNSASANWFMHMVTLRSESNDTPPTAPTSLTATAASSTQINLSWTASTDNVGVTGYYIQRCVGSGCTNFAQIAEVSGSTTIYVDASVAPLTTYTYEVIATDAAGNLSTPSNSASATTPADTTPPTAPTNLTATAASSTQINLSWTASTDNVGVTGYKIDRCEGSGCTNFAQVGTSTTTSYSDTGLLASTSYGYEVRATDAAGNLGAFSNVASMATSSTAPPPAIALVQHIEETAGTGISTTSQTFSAVSTSGDLIVVTVKWGDQTLSASVSDSKGNMYTSVIGPTNWSGTAKRAQTFYAKNIAGGGAAITITATLTGTASSSLQLFQSEYANANTATPADVSASATGTGTSMSSGTVTTALANDLIYGVAFEDDGVASAGTGFTTVSTFHGNLEELESAATAGAYSATATNTLSANWLMHLVALRH